ncbi:MAG: hypothetical protein ACFFKA_08635, partial [Candidatus Thorarchaeota archaeon]
MDNKRMELLAGFSILFIVVSNAVNFWLVPNGQIRYIIAFILIILELFGATFYIFLNSLKVSFLLEKRMGCVADKVNRNKVLKQGILLILLGIPFNIIINPIYEFPNNLWGWNIFTFLGFSQILCYVSYKMVRWTRIIIGLIIIFLTAGIRQFLFSLKDFDLVFEIAYFVIVSPYPSYSLLPFAAFCFFSTVFGELLYEARILKSRLAELNAIKSILKYGIVLLCIGLIIPIMEFRPILTESNYNPVEYPFSDMPSILISELIVFVP